MYGFTCNILNVNSEYEAGDITIPTRLKTCTEFSMAKVCIAESDRKQIFMCQKKKGARPTAGGESIRG